MLKSFHDVLKDQLWLITSGFCLVFFSVFGQTIFIGTFVPHIRADFGLSHGAIGTIYGSVTLLSAGVILWSGKFLDTLPLLRYIVIVLCVLAAATFVLAAAPALWLLIPALFLVRHCGQGLMVLTYSTAFNRYLGPERGRAMSIASMGLSLHGVIFPFLAQTLLGYFDWRLIWAGTGVFILCGLIPLFMWLLSDHEGVRHAPWRARMDQQHKDHTRPAEADEDTQRTTQAASQWRRARVLRDWRFYAVAAVLLIAGMFNTGIFFYQNTVAGYMGLSPVVFAGLLPVFMIASISVTFVSGWVLDHKGEEPLLIAGPLLYLCGLIAFISGLGWPAAALGFLCIGGATGFSGLTGGPVLARLYGTLHLGAIKSMLSAAVICGTAVAPPLFGLLMDRGIGMATILQGCGLYVILAWISVILAMRYFPPRGTHMDIQK